MYKVLNRISNFNKCEVYYVKKLHYMIIINSKELLIVNSVIKNNKPEIFKCGWNRLHLNRVFNKKSLCLRKKDKNVELKSSMMK